MRKCRNQKAASARKTKAYVCDKRVMEKKVRGEERKKKAENDKDIKKKKKRKKTSGGPVFSLSLSARPSALGSPGLENEFKMEPQHQRARQPEKSQRFN